MLVRPDTCTRTPMLQLRKNDVGVKIRLSPYWPVWGQFVFTAAIVKHLLVAWQACDGWANGEMVKQGVGGHAGAGLSSR